MKQISDDVLQEAFRTVLKVKYGIVWEQGETVVDMVRRRGFPFSRILKGTRRDN